MEENVVPDRNILVYHVTPYVHSAPNQSVRLDDQFDISEYEHKVIDEKINVSKAYYKFMVFLYHMTILTPTSEDPKHWIWYEKEDTLTT
ncbi:MAG: hypothetical protein F4039_10030 [Gammaproteobacteria bacterium]|nr:hypothetical protein [Gammaproteobacteria bacterium]MYK44408.1 hypothetical protein [Gammaproteobacteria bacterium]